jgi:hypothetical protein
MTYQVTADQPELRYLTIAAALRDMSYDPFHRPLDLLDIP